MYKKTTLKNGLRIITAPMPQVKSVTALILVGAGSRYETKKTNGIAHFAEHMFFKGTKKRPAARAISMTIDGVGGVINAFTGQEYTGFWVKAAATHLNLALDVLTDMILDSKFDSKEINRERGVITEEINLYLDTPSSYVGDLFMRALYGDHPLGWDIAGQKKVIKKVSRQDFLSYLRSLYHPNNMVVSLAGDLDGPEAQKEVEKFLGRLKKTKSASFEPFEKSQNKPQLKVKFKRTDQAHFCLGFPAYPIGHKDRYALSVLNSVLGVGMSSRLFIEVRERRGLAYYSYSSVGTHLDTGFLVAQSGVDIKRINEAIKVILSEFDKLRNKKVGAKEFAKAKEIIKGRLVLGLEDSQAVANFFGGQELLEKKIKTPEQVIKKIDAVTASDVQRVARDIFVNKGLNLAVIGPFKDKGKFEKILKL